MRPAVVLACLAAGCGSLPTAPSALAAPTDPVAAAPQPLPAPLSQTLTGTWFLGAENFMTLTQDGLWITGMERPSTQTIGAVTTTSRATISGTVCGDAVTLERAVVFVISAGERRMSCTATDTFAGTIAGNTLSGRYTAATTALACNDAPPIVLKTIDGPTTFTRQ